MSDSVLERLKQQLQKLVETFSDTNAGFHSLKERSEDIQGRLGALDLSKYGVPPEGDLAAHLGSAATQFGNAAEQLLAAATKAKTWIDGQSGGSGAASLGGSTAPPPAGESSGTSDAGGDTAPPLGPSKMTREDAIQVRTKDAPDALEELNEKKEAYKDAASRRRAAIEKELSEQDPDSPRVAELKAELEREKDRESAFDELCNPSCHALERHEGQVSLRMLVARVLYLIDPWHGNHSHGCGDQASAFRSIDVMVDTLAAIKARSDLPNLEAPEPGPVKPKRFLVPAADVGLAGAKWAEGLDLVGVEAVLDGQQNSPDFGEQRRNEKRAGSDSQASVRRQNDRPGFVNLVCIQYNWDKNKGRWVLTTMYPTHVPSKEAKTSLPPNWNPNP